MAAYAWYLGILVLVGRGACSAGEGMLTPPPPQDLVDEVKQNTNLYHMGLHAFKSFAANESAESPVQQVVNETSDAVKNVTAAVASPGPAVENLGLSPALAPAESILQKAAGAIESVTGSGSGNSKYALPALIIIVLAIAAAIGFFIVYWRRKRARSYHGLREAELNSVQMHRS